MRSRFPSPLWQMIQLSPLWLRFPFYFELKIAFVIWLLSPYTKGSSVLYRKFVHPTLSNKERVRAPLKTICVPSLMVNCLFAIVWLLPLLCCRRSMSTLLRPKTGAMRPWWGLESGVSTWLPMLPSLQPPRWATECDMAYFACAHLKERARLANQNENVLWLWVSGW